MYFSIYLVFKISSSIEIRRNKLDISLKEEEEEKKNKIILYISSTHLSVKSILLRPILPLSELSLRRKETRLY